MDGVDYWQMEFSGYFIQSLQDREKPCMVVNILGAVKGYQKIVLSRESGVVSQMILSQSPLVLGSRFCVAHLL